MITDGERTAAYFAFEDVPLSRTGLKIVPSHVEAAAYSDANCTALTYEGREVVYVPVEGLKRPKVTVELDTGGTEKGPAS